MQFSPVEVKPYVRVNPEFWTEVLTLHQEKKKKRKEGRFYLNGP